MSDKQSVVAEARAAFREFQSSIDGLSDEQLTVAFLDDWSVREVAGHLTGWLGQMTSGFQRMAEGQRPTPDGTDWSDVQAWNTGFAADVKDRNARELVTELDSRVEALVAALQALPDDRFGENKTANRMADAAAIHHFREHAEEITAARQAGKL